MIAQQMELAGAHLGQLSLEESLQARAQRGQGGRGARGGRGGLPQLVAHAAQRRAAEGRQRVVQQLAPRLLELLLVQAGVFTRAVHALLRLLEEFTAKYKMVY